LEQEVLKVLLLDSRNRLIKVEDVFKGSLNEISIHPREVFKPAIENSAAFIILAHNHPSGDPQPSEEDLKMTTELLKASNIICIPILDHIIIGNNNFVSLKKLTDRNFTHYLKRNLEIE
jgi:DNA repair protein RadC